MSSGRDVAEVIARWTWRMIFSPHGVHALIERQETAILERLNALADMARADIEALHQAARADLAAQVDRLDVLVAEREDELRAALDKGVPASKGVRRGDGFAATPLLAFVTSAGAVVAAAVASAAPLGLDQANLWPPALGVLIVAAIVGGVAGERLVHPSTSRARRIAGCALALTSAGAFLVGAVAGLGALHGLLLAALGGTVIACSAAMWWLSGKARVVRSTEAGLRAAALARARLREARGAAAEARSRLEALDFQWSLHVREVEALYEHAAAIAREHELVGAALLTG